MSRYDSEQIQTPDSGSSGFVDNGDEISDRSGSPPYYAGFYNKNYEQDPETGQNVAAFSTQKSRADAATLSWKDIVVTAQNPNLKWKDKLPWAKKEEGTHTMPKQILKRVSGVVNPGTLQVIMGASGSGKTTLLNVLTRRNLESLDVEGQVLVNGQNIGDEIATISAYIQQDDLMIGTLSVQEHLWFNAELRMDKHYTKEEKQSRVADVILEMGLVKVADTKIGVPGMIKGLSGGEMKRLAFGAALLTRPSILFCDEPTSGLDSFMAQSVVQALKELAERGRTIITTIHQPSSQVFEMFDQILFMGEGRTAYMGPESEVSSFFSELGFESPLNYNPADFYIHTLAIVPGDEAESRALLQRVCNEYENSTHYRTVAWQLESISSHSNHSGDRFREEMDDMEKQYSSRKDTVGMDWETSKYKASWLTQFMYCWWRANVDLLRNKKVLIGRVGYLIVTGIALGLLYLQQDLDQLGTSNINSAMFVLSIQVCYNTCFSICTAFSREYPVFLREHHDRTYTATAYYLAKSLTDYPLIFFAAFCYGTAAYWLIGLNPDVDKYFTGTAALMLVCSVATAIGHAGGSLFPNPQLALTFVPFYMGIMLLFTGFLMKEGTFLVIFQPLQLISHFKYAYESLLINQWENIYRIDCEYLEDPSEFESGETNWTVMQSCIHNGKQVLDSFGYESEDLPLCFMANCLLLLGFETLGIVAFWIKARK